MNTKISKLLAIVAVAMMVTTVFAAIASDDASVTGDVASSNKKRTQVDPVVIDDTWTTSRLVWSNCPDVLFDVVDGIPTITFNNANIEIELDDNIRECIKLDVSPTYDIVLKGNNEIHMKADASDGASNLFIGCAGYINIHGTSMKDTLILSAQPYIKTAKNSMSINGLVSCKIKDCTIKFTLEKEINDENVTNRTVIPISGDMELTNMRLIISMGSAEKDYVLTGFWGGNTTFKNSVIRLETSDKIASGSTMFRLDTPLTIDCCKIEVEMTNGTVFSRDGGSETVTFDNFNQIDLYDTLAGEPRVVPGGESYQLTDPDWDVVKIAVDSNVKEPTDETDNSVAVTVAIIASMLLAVFAVAIVLVGFRR